MKVLVIGSGGREHAFAWRFAREGHEVLVAPGNDGMRTVAETIPISEMNFASLIRLAQTRKVDFTVVGPDEPIAHGIVGAFTAVGLPIFGPTKQAAIIEWSKAEAKRLMHLAKIPTARETVYDNAKTAHDALHSLHFPVYVKESGLARGRGARYCASRAEARKMLERAGEQKESTDRRIIVEDVLLGRDVSMHALADSHQLPQYQLFPPSCDHKRLYTGGTGPNTGGMGAFAPVPWMPDKTYREIASCAIGNMLLALGAIGQRYTGIIYPGLMIGNGDVFNVLEYNARGGDPEIEVYMRLLGDDVQLLEVLCATAKGQPNRVQLTWKTSYAMSIALVSKEYGIGTPVIGKPITGIREAERMTNVVVFHGATTFRDNRYYTNGGRVLHVTAYGETLREARDRAYEACAVIRFEGMHYRRDIAAGIVE